MDAASSTILRNYLSNSVNEIFTIAGVQLLPIRPSCGSFAHESRVLGFISFTGNQMRGSITLNLPAMLVSRVYPKSAASAADEYDLRDCTGELLNQIVGRLKAHLLRHAIALELSAPSTLCRARGRPPRSRAPGAIELHFSSSEGNATVTFDAVARRSVDLKVAVTTDVAVPPGISKSGLFE